MGLALLSRKRADFGPDRRIFRAKAGNLPDSYAILRIAGGEGSSRPNTRCIGSARA